MKTRNQVILWAILLAGVFITVASAAESAPKKSAPPKSSREAEKVNAERARPADKMAEPRVIQRPSSRPTGSPG